MIRSLWLLRHGAASEREALHFTACAHCGQANEVASLLFLATATTKRVASQIDSSTFFRPQAVLPSPNSLSSLKTSSSYRTSCFSPDTTMDDQNMTAYDPPNPPDTAAHETENSHENYTNRPHTHGPAHSRHNKKKKNRNYGLKAMNKLAMALVRSTPRNQDNKKHGNGKKLSKKQRKKLRIRQSGSQNGESATRETRSMKGMLPLPFDNVYLRVVGDRGSFMTNDQIMDWIKSVFNPHIKNWYHECLSAPENQPCVEAAQDAPYAFAEAVLQEAMDQHSSSGLLGSLLGETDACPTAFHSQKEGTGNLTFIQHSAMVACLVVRDGQLSHPFSTNACRRKRHHAAAMLLTSVIVNIKTHSGYFLRHLYAEQKAMEREAQRVERRASPKEASKIFPISSSEMFGSVGRALQDLEHNSNFKISFRKPDISMDEYLVVLAGTARQVREAEEEVLKILADNTEVDLLSAQAEELSIQ